MYVFHLNLYLLVIDFHLQMANQYRLENDILLYYMGVLKSNFAKSKEEKEKLFLVPFSFRFSLLM